MKVLISGAGGLIGRAVSALLQRARARGLRAWCATRRRRAPATCCGSRRTRWTPAQLAGFDAIVHLAGRPVATLLDGDGQGGDPRQPGARERPTWRRRRRRHSGRDGRPRALICGSAIGYYGSRGDEELVEESEPGLGFLAEVCRQWESAAQPAAMAGVRVAHMRTSLVLSPAGGALAKMLPAFRLGVAGRLGSGRQWWSWVSLRGRGARLCLCRGE